MYHGTKFIFMFVAWYCVNTVRSSPIPFANELDCGNKCRTDETDGIEINDHLHQDLNERPSSTLTGRVFPKRKKRQTINDESDVASFSPEGIVAPDDPVKATTQIDSDGQSKELPLLRQDETEFTDSVEYEKAQANLLSASEQVKVKDIQEGPADDTSLADTNFPEANIQGKAEIDTIENILTKNHPTSSISSSTKPNSSKTEIPAETEEFVSIDVDKVAVKSDDEIGSDSLIEPVDPISEDAETENTADGSTKITSAVENFIEPIDGKSNGDNGEADAGTSIDEAGLESNSEPTAIGDTKNLVVPLNPTENGINEAITNPAQVDKAKSQEKNTAADTVKTLTNSADTLEDPEISSGPKTLSISDELHQNTPDETDSIKQDETKKLDAEPEQLGITEQQIDSIFAAEDEDVDDIETKNVSKQLKDIPNSPATSPDADNNSNGVKQLTNEEDAATDDDSVHYYNHFDNQDESHIYDPIDWNEELTETNTFDGLIEDRNDHCNDHHHHHIEIPEHNDGFREDNVEYAPIEEIIDESCVEDCDQTDYSRTYENRIEYSQHTDDENSRDFSDGLDPGSDLMDSDIEFDARRQYNSGRFDGNTDDFDFDDNFE